MTEREYHYAVTGQAIRDAIAVLQAATPLPGWDDIWTKTDYDAVMLDLMRANDRACRAVRLTNDESNGAGLCV